MKEITGSDYAQRCQRLDGFKNKKYWGTNVEMSARAFENFIVCKLSESKFSNDYLANFRDESEWQKPDLPNISTYPYPTKEESPALNAKFQNLFDTIEEKLNVQTSSVMLCEPTMEYKHNNQQTLNFEYNETAVEKTTKKIDFYKIAEENDFYETPAEKFAYMLAEGLNPDYYNFQSNNNHKKDNIMETQTKTADMVILDYFNSKTDISNVIKVLKLPNGVDENVIRHTLEDYKLEWDMSSGIEEKTKRTEERNMVLDYCTEDISNFIGRNIVADKPSEKIWKWNDFEITQSELENTALDSAENYLYDKSNGVRPNGPMSDFYDNFGQTDQDEMMYEGLIMEYLNLYERYKNDPEIQAKYAEPELQMCEPTIQYNSQTQTPKGTIMLTEEEQLDLQNGKTIIKLQIENYEGIKKDISIRKINDRIEITEKKSQEISSKQTSATELPKSRMKL